MERPFLSTYRVQLTAQFTLHHARARLPYLEQLGISHLYCSPVFAARAGSAHGYDVTDPTRVSESLGGEAAFVQLATEAHARGIGILLDIVPNHMGIGAENPWWDDVLTHGSESRFAEWFDVSWRATPRELHNRILLPVLGDTLENVLARGEITVEHGPVGSRLRYFEHSFPVRPGTDAAIDATDAAAISRLIGRQHYALAHWRAANRDLNYRRFFDVNDLICLRVERADVFEATHAVVLDFIARGLVDAVRVDHIDGLLEPRPYLVRLREAIQARRSGPIPILVEKILAPGEALSPRWPADGTTGYEFLTVTDDLLIDAAGIRVIESQYRRAEDSDFGAVALASKRRVLRSALNADIRRIAPMLAALAREAGWPAVSVAAYAGVIVDFVAHLPVYRTYLDTGHPNAEDHDREVIERAIEGVRGASHDATALAALRDTLLSDWRSAPPVSSRLRLSFVLRLQQLSGPAAAKGIEDTAIYAFAPLASRSEVGGNPGIGVADAPSRLHYLLAARAQHWPRALNAVTTHDTKRSADSRARLDALSELPQEWHRALRRWTRHHRPAQRLLGGRLVPSRTTQDFIYQAVIAIWPVAGESNADILARSEAYITKALREGKVTTSWTDPDVEFEAAVAAFIAELFAPGNSVFQSEMGELVLRLDQLARAKMVSRVVVQCLAPGVPDVYQGDEIWYTALVDPDNRRPVDVARADAALARITGLHRAVDAASTSDLKMAVLRALLALRRHHPALVMQGTYEPVVVRGTHAQRLFAFRRVHGDEELIVVVGTLTEALAGNATGDAWGDTHLLVGERAGTLHCILHDAPAIAHDGTIRVRDLFTSVTAAVLVNASPQ